MIYELYQRLLALPTRYAQSRKHQEPEAKECIEFVDRLKASFLEGKLKGQFLHIANEGKCRPIMGLFLKRMGKISGAPDYVFTWNGGCGYIEMKSKKGKLSENQKLFKSWCENTCTLYAVCYSAEEAWNIITEWGFVK